eukprot:TRINITY_DN14170_c0_g1_i1.p1 TRINITY_DN14170_c0_g1~~TRINITY_DN14170_c0_g1_i1.p1  ORF type:complete len:331 (-),score=93.40 TRINITY_DN14170_c0_g1_i1:92-1084(-)
MADDADRIDVVELDGLVVLKIIQHSQDHLPELVTGQLLGLDRDDGNTSVLEVTSSFPYPSRSSDLEEEAGEGGETYQYDMMRCLREINFDYNTVGWYSSSLMGSFLDETTIESQFNFQSNIKKSILLVYDPLKTSQGVLSLRAFRLSAAFMDLYKSSTFTKDSITKAGLSFDHVYVEVPVKIHNAQLVNALLLELDQSTSMSTGVAAASELARLELGGETQLAKSVEFVIERLDELGAEHGKLQYWQRNAQRQQAQHNAWLQKRKAENAARKAAGEEPLPEVDPGYKPLPEPTRLDSLLIENHVNEFCDQLNRFSSQSLSKLFLFESLLV